MAIKTSGSEGGNLALGLTGRVLGGIGGFLVGGPAGISTGWSLGGTLGDSFATPLTYTTTKRDISPIDVNQQYQNKTLSNRQSNFRQDTTESAGWAPTVLSATDMAVNLTSGIMDFASSKKPTSKLGKFWNSESPLSGTKKTPSITDNVIEPSGVKTGQDVSTEGISFKNLSDRMNTGNEIQPSSVGNLFDVNKSINDITKSINRSWLKNTKKTGMMDGLPARIEDFGPTSSVFKSPQTPFLNQNIQFNPYV